MGKGSTRRKCKISREEETLRYDLAFGKITFEEWVTGMQRLKEEKDAKGLCVRCKFGAMVGPNYKITCLILTGVHGPYHSCPQFEEER